MESSYSLQLVVLSYVVAVLASHVTLSLAQRLRETHSGRGARTIYWPWILQQLGCDMAQGYLFAKAMPMQEWLRWMDTRRPGAVSTTPTRDGAALG